MIGEDLETIMLAIKKVGKDVDRRMDEVTKKNKFKIMKDKIIQACNLRR